MFTLVEESVYDLYCIANLPTHGPFPCTNRPKPHPKVSEQYVLNEGLSAFQMSKEQGA